MARRRRGGTRRADDWHASLEGVDECLHKLSALQGKITGRDLRAALEPAAEELADFQRALAPVGEGPTHGRDYIRVFLADTGNRPTNMQYDVGPYGPGFYLTFHETGTMYMAPSPFMRPAARLAMPHMIRAFKEEILWRIYRVAGSFYGR